MLDDFPAPSLAVGGNNADTPPLAVGGDDFTSTSLAFDEDIGPVHPEADEDNWEEGSTFSDASTEGLDEEDDDDVVPSSFRLSVDEDPSNAHLAEDRMVLDPPQPIQEDDRAPKVYGSESEPPRNPSDPDPLPTCNIYRPQLRPPSL